MVITVRYRDIPWEQARECSTQAGISEKSSEIWEKHMRGKDIRIAVPAMGVKKWKYARCGGPFFEIIEPIRGLVGEMVCPHLAEIGD